MVQFCILTKAFQTSCHLLLNCWSREFAVNRSTNCAAWSQAHSLRVMYICLLLYSSANQPAPAVPTPSLLGHITFLSSQCVCRCVCVCVCIYACVCCMTRDLERNNSRTIPSSLSLVSRPSNPISSVREADGASPMSHLRPILLFYS